MRAVEGSDISEPFLSITVIEMFVDQVSVDVVIQLNISLFISFILEGKG